MRSSPPERSRLPLLPFEVSLDGLGDLLLLKVGDWGCVGCTIPSFFASRDSADSPVEEVLVAVVPLMLPKSAGKLPAVAR